MASKNPAPPKLAELTREELIAIVIKQGELIAELQKRIEELLRKAGRQASPFSKNRPKTNPKPPGRSLGKALLHTASHRLSNPPIGEYRRRHHSDARIAAAKWTWREWTRPR